MKKISIHSYLINKRKQNKKWRKIQLAVFLGLLIFFFLIGLAFFARPKTSAIEKRELSPFPAFTLTGIWNGSFFSDLMTWYSDTYPLREGMIKAQQKMEGFYGYRKTAIYGSTVTKGEEIPSASSESVLPAPTMENPSSSSTAGTTSAAGALPQEETGTESTSEAEPADGTIRTAPEVAGTIFVADGRGFESYYFSQENADAYASMINTVRAKLPENVTLYDMIVPNGFGVCLDEEVQKSVGASNQRDAIDYIYSRLDPKVQTVSVFDKLKKHNSEYIYFNTDHHWTALGAYYAYEEFCRKKGIQPHDLSEFEEKTFDGFLGSFYAYSNQSQALADHPDTVHAYVPMGTNDMFFIDSKGNTMNWNVIEDVSDYASEAKYNTFIGGDEPYSEINNPNLSDDSACLIVKESYGNAFVPFLVDHYQHVYIIDYRYYKENLNTLIREKNVQDVLFLNNTEAAIVSKAQQMNKLFS